MLAVPCWPLACPEHHCAHLDVGQNVDLLDFEANLVRAEGHNLLQVGSVVEVGAVLLLWPVALILQRAKESVDVLLCNEQLRL